MSDKILFVDDEPSALEGFRRILHGSFDVQVAGSGGEALLTLDRDGPFAVVISDMRMPGMNGADFLARVRQAAPETVRMMLTGHADLHAAMDAVNRGQILHFLTKPCPKDVLVAAINSGLDQYHTTREEKQLARKARLMQRGQFDWTADAPLDCEEFESPIGLPGPAQARVCLEPLIGRDAQTYTVLLRTPVLETVEQRYGENAGETYLTKVAGLLQHALAVDDRLFHWRRNILLAVLHRYISPLAVRREVERMVAETRGSIIELDGKSTMMACLVTFDLLAVVQFSGFGEWLEAFEARCGSPQPEGAGVP